MHTFVRNFITEWRRLDLPFAGETVVAAVSGGADSVSLLLALHELKNSSKLELWFVANATGNPPVSNFGLDYPALFWQVAEVRTAFTDLTQFSLTSNDWKVWLSGRPRSALGRRDHRNLVDVGLFFILHPRKKKGRGSGRTLRRERRGEIKRANKLFYESRERKRFVT